MYIGYEQVEAGQRLSCLLTPISRFYILWVDRVQKSVTGGLLDYISIAYYDLIVLIAYCSQTFLVYLFIWCARISYRPYVVSLNCQCMFRNRW